MSLTDTNTVLIAKKYFCPLCNFKTHKKYNLDMHKRNRHSAQEYPKDGISQQGSGSLLMNQPISSNNQQTGTHVPIQDFKDYIQQWQEVYQNMQVRIKQLEEEIAQLEACRNEDTNMLYEELKKVSILEPELQKLSQINKQWSEAYRQLQVHLQNQV